jgi:hypothetical protein
MELDPKIWKHLPDDLIRQIIGMADISIDARLAFGILPKRLDEAKAWRLWYLLKSHDGIVYNLETESLHILRFPGAYIVRRPVQLDWIDSGLWCFNADGKEHSLEMSTTKGEFIMLPSKIPWLTELRVLLRGSGLNASGSSF